MTPLRFVILTEPGRLLGWQHECISQLTSSGNAKIVLVVENGTPVAPAARFWEKWCNYPWRHLLWRLFDRFAKPHASRDIGYGNAFENIPVITCVPHRKGKWSDYFSNGDLQKIAAHKPDVILRFGFRILKGGILTLARFGVWSYHHSDPDRYRGGPPFFYEILHRDPISGAVLQKINNQIDSGTVLCKGAFKTSLHSYRETANNVLYGSAVYVNKVVNELVTGNTTKIDQPPLQNKHLQVNKIPENVKFITFCARMLTERLNFHFTESVLADYWNVGTADLTPEKVVKSGLISDVKWLPEQRDSSYIADPFPVFTYNETKVYCEKYIYKQSKGCIAEVDIKSGNSRSVLSSEHHYSYPFLLRDNGNLYMLPECISSNRLMLYRYNEKTVTWVKHSVLIEGQQIVDPTILQFNGLWWLFCTIGGSYSNVQLHIYHASELTGPYTQHICNPVKTNVSSVRPAGPFFNVENELYRPAQDCSQTYGGAIVVNRVEKLSVDEYVETPVQRIVPQPDWKYNRGLHHIAFSNGKTIIDAKKYRFNRHYFLSYFCKKIKG